MSASNAFETALLDELFKQIAIPGLTANLYLALHTATLDDTAGQSTSEAAYTGYARIPIERIAGNWVVAGNQVENINEILFGECTLGTETITDFSIGVAAAGAGMILVYGALQTPVEVSPGVTPRFQANTLVTTVD